MTVWAQNVNVVIITESNNQTVGGSCVADGTQVTVTPYAGFYNIAEDVVEDVDKVAATTACLFFGYFDGATTISESCGGGGGNNELPKKKDNEDELFFALRCHQMAKTMHAPKYRLRR